MTDAVDTSAGERRRPPVRVVRVVGTGLVGASVALALRRLDVDVLLADPSPTALALSRDLGAGRVDDGGTEPDLVVVAAPPDVVADVVLAEPGRPPARGGHRRRQREGRTAAPAVGRRCRPAPVRRRPPAGRPRAVRGGRGARGPVRGPALGRRAHGGQRAGGRRAWCARSPPRWGRG
ncbi:hypothetical protein GCM10025868_44910 [Angustibacter aerolatus]|uniref:Prephenate dehydrogenase nucleotide-binding domain-containing protein n=1 Tax=Angustibacter aerolatus TaxID=1162965 RepID=A0ABQ6JRC8_9ACTN|nr:hypothetical protein [Angustibacter aerolatus]GMA89241.1 hypothetical protein GCM10025868_44910 [Angustibacter aerolatus]